MWPAILLSTGNEQHRRLIGKEAQARDKNKGCNAQRSIGLAAEESFGERLKKSIGKSIKYKKGCFKCRKKVYVFGQEWV